MNHNDSLLCLDELGQSDPDKVGEATYMLANGSKKVRSDASGDSKPTEKWRTLYLGRPQKSTPKNPQAKNFGVVFQGSV